MGASTTTTTKLPSSSGNPLWNSSLRPRRSNVDSSPTSSSAEEALLADYYETTKDNNSGVKINLSTDSSDSDGDRYSLSNNNKHHPSSSSSLLMSFLRKPMVKLLVVGPVCAFAVGLGYWWSIHVGLIKYDTNCPIAKFEYPHCMDHIMHYNAQERLQQMEAPFSSDKWLEWRHLYVESLDKAGLIDRNSMAADWQQPDTHGFVVPLDFHMVPGRGRGVFARQLIPKGTKIWDSRYRAVFPNECSAKHFFNSLPDHHKCDAMFWGYINNFYGTDGIQYMIDLDGHGYINHATSAVNNCIHHFESEMETTKYGSFRMVPWGGYLHDPLQRARRNRPGSYALYAKHDIQPGEEITYDYGEIFQVSLFDWYSYYVSHSLPITEWWTI